MTQIILATIDGGYILNGTTFGTNPYHVSNLGSSVFTVRSKNDIEVNGGLRLRNVPSQGVASSIDAMQLLHKLRLHIQHQQHLLLLQPLHRLKVQD